MVVLLTMQWGKEQWEREGGGIWKGLQALIRTQDARNAMALYVGAMLTRLLVPKRFLFKKSKQSKTKCMFWVPQFIWMTHLVECKGNEEGISPLFNYMQEKSLRFCLKSIVKVQLCYLKETIKEK